MKDILIQFSDLKIEIQDKVQKFIIDNGLTNNFVFPIIINSNGGIL